MGSAAISGGCDYTNGNGQVDIPTNVIDGSSGTSATGWHCTNTANDRDNTTAYALCCPVPTRGYDETLASFFGIDFGVGNSQTIHGTVDFVQRKGIAPGSLDSITYWSVVVRSNGVDYELSNVFDIESGARPESTTIAGKALHAGDQVTIQGKVQRVRKDFSLLSKVGRVELK